MLSAHSPCWPRSVHYRFSVSHSLSLSILLSIFERRWLQRRYQRQTNNTWRNLCLAKNESNKVNFKLHNISASTFNINIQRSTFCASNLAMATTTVIKRKMMNLILKFWAHGNCSSAGSVHTHECRYLMQHPTSNISRFCLASKCVYFLLKSH